MKRIGRISLALAISVLIAVASIVIVEVSSPVASAQKLPYSLFISSPNMSYVAGQDIPVDITITNVSGKEATIGLVVGRYQAEFNTEIYVWSDTGGRAKRTDYGRMLDDPNAATEVSLSSDKIVPGGQAHDGIIANRIYDMRRPGTYVVQVQRGHSNHAVRSNKITVTVTP